MRSPVAGVVALILLFVVIIVGYSSVFTVSQTEQVLVVRLGEPVRVVTEPGLNFKAPFIDTVISIDKRILDLENPSQEVIASDQKRLVVDAFARYRIKNALRFYQSIGSIQAANIQLTTLLNASLRRVLGEVTFITGGSRRARSADGADPRPARQGGRPATASRWSTCGSAAPTCRSRTARRSISGCRPSGSARPPSSAPRAARRRRKSAPRPIARRPSSSPKPIRPPSRRAASATPSATGCSPRPMARIRTSSPSTARCRPMRTGFEEQRHPLPAAAGFRVLPLLCQSVGPSAGGRGGGAEAVTAGRLTQILRRRGLRVASA